VAYHIDDVKALMLIHHPARTAQLDQGPMNTEEKRGTGVADC
jgi:hypothetical protein